MMRLTVMIEMRTGMRAMIPMMTVQYLVEKKTRTRHYSLPTQRQDTSDKRATPLGHLGLLLILITLQVPSLPPRQG